MGLSNFCQEKLEKMTDVVLSIAYLFICIFCSSFAQPKYKFSSNYDLPDLRSIYFRTVDNKYSYKVRNNVCNQSNPRARLATFPTNESVLDLVNYLRAELGKFRYD